MLDISDNLYEHLMTLEKDVLIDIMAEALDFMQGYNGRTKTYCIMEAMGAEIIENDDGSITYKFGKK